MKKQFSALGHVLLSLFNNQKTRKQANVNSLNEIYKMRMEQFCKIEKIEDSKGDLAENQFLRLQDLQYGNSRN